MATVSTWPPLVDRQLEHGGQFQWCYNCAVQRRAGIYIHIPFCERKCTYCNFNTTDYFESLAERYINAVAGEIDALGARLRSETGDAVQVDAIYFGGGTPSIIEAEQLARLLQHSRGAFDVDPESEITIEINPATIARGKVDQWLDAGINRASVGVQSFIDSELLSLSRTHTADQARGTLVLLREAGFENISLDLIAGLPEQSLTDWEFNLREAVAIRPEHLSLYLLDLKEGTQLFGQVTRGLRRLPDDDLVAEMYRMTCDVAAEAGYEHYEISNFAHATERAMTLAGRTRGSAPTFRSKHNLKYWTGDAYYGVGCGAHSYDGRDRWSNVLKTETYIERIAHDGQAIAERHRLGDDDRAAEALFMGLRLKEGVSLTEFHSEYGVDVIERYGGDLPRLADAGLIELEGGRLALTPAGRLLSNEVFVSFV